VGTPTNGAAAISGTMQIVYTPPPNFTGATVFTYTATDGGLESTATVTVHVTPVNDSPTISTVGDLTITVNASTGPINFTVGDLESGGALTVTGNSSNLALVPEANIVLDGSAANRTVTIAPATGQTGTALITLTVSDGQGGTAQSAFRLVVLALRLFLPLSLR
jgi:hypothetical protein